MTIIERLLEEIQKLMTQIQTIQNSYYKESNKAHIVEQRLGKLSEEVHNKMCEYHLLLTEWEEIDIVEGFGTIMSIKEFGQKSAVGEYHDDSGYAFYVTDNQKETNIQVFSSWVLGRNYRKDFQDIIWYTNDEISAMNSEFEGTNYDEIEEEF